MSSAPRFHRHADGSLNYVGGGVMGQNDDGTWSPVEPLQRPSQTVAFWRKVATSWAGVALWLSIVLYFAGSGFLCFLSLICGVFAGVGFVMGLSSILLDDPGAQRRRGR